MAPAAIPQPKTYGPLGNLPSINPREPIQSMMRLAGEFGPIFRLKLPGRSTIVISSHELVADACDESRFDKAIGAALKKVRRFSGDGLFTAWTDEANWRKAHHILLPSFSQRAMKAYHPMMLDLATQLVQKWARLNPEETVDVADDMTRLTLDTIGLCGFNYRFNSFYREQPHPFIVAMSRALRETMNELGRIGLQNRLMIRTQRQLDRDIQTMFSLVDTLIAERKQQGSDVQDLLAHMLEGVDPESGEKLDDENIRYQIITFLIAGHETTSGLLSFAVYYLLKNPQVLEKARAEADRVLTGDEVGYNQVRELKYTRMVLQETLRLWPTAPAFVLYAKDDTMLVGKYALKKRDGVVVLIPQLHRDPGIWGADANQFRPERFEDPREIPRHAYKPFGNGQRSCIGQQFAMQEATLVLGMALNRFDLIDYANYDLKVRETLTVKPADFRIRVRVRTPPTAMAPIAAATVAEHSVALTTQNRGTPLLVLYGSNLGTAEGIARELAETGASLGFQTEAETLDAYAGKIPKQGAVLIVTASYNGTPPDNARKFIDWLEHAPVSDLTGVNYAVFGCGDHNWASTYQRIPQLIDERFASKGATRLMARGEGDASDDFESQYTAWRDPMWQHLTRVFSPQPAAPGEVRLTVKFVSREADASLPARILENRELQSAMSERSTRHIEIALPEGAVYHEGDHLAVLPRNDDGLVERVLRRFHLQEDTQVMLGGRAVAHLPMNRAVQVSRLLRENVELQEPATRAQIREIAASTSCPPHRRELEALVEDEAYRNGILEKRVSLLDLLEDFPACELPFERFLEMLAALKRRYYSISSSPRVSPDRASITVGVTRGPAWSGRGEYHGVASNYLAGLSAGDPVAIFVRTPDSGFQPPEDPATPMIMVGPGTGVAPFRGFLQLRRVRSETGAKLGEAHLYFGCRDPQCDFLYREEFERDARDGLVTLHTAFSRVEGRPKRYVQHRIREEAEMLIGLLDRGAKFFVCGDGAHMAPDVEATLREAYEKVHHEDSQAWIERLQRERRYVKDIWSG